MTVGDLLGDSINLEIPIISITLGSSTVANTKEGLQLLIRTAQLLSIWNPMVEITFNLDGIQHIIKTEKISSYPIPEKVQPNG